MNVLLNRNVIATETPDEYELYMKMSMILAKEVHAVCYDQLPAAMNLLAFFMSVPGSIPSHAYWKTPDGLAVKQIYGAKVAEPVRYRLEYTDEETGEITYKQVFNRYTFLDNDGKNRTKAANGMPPNWVHSLDGTLVRRVVLAVDFPVICIHDSFAAHPSDCGKLKIALQEQFSRLIVDRPLENLISYLNEQLGANVFSAENLIVDTLDPYEPLESEFIFC
jgi:DNA-directed RNA polymerase